MLGVPDQGTTKAGTTTTPGEAAGEASSSTAIGPLESTSRGSVNAPRTDSAQADLFARLDQHDVAQLQRPVRRLRKPS